MKKLIKFGAMLLLLSMAIFSCKKVERDLDENLSAVSKLLLPANNAVIDLLPTTSASVLFSWEQTFAADSNAVLYELVFDKVSGDFSNPIYKVLSDQAGIGTEVVISHKELVKVAAFAGILAETTGDVKWTVLASKASNRKIATEVRTLSLKRPAGFAELPAAIFLTGTATEGGTNIAQAVPTKRLESGVFEVYTKLSPGTYQLTDKATAGGKTFYTEGNVIKEGTTSITVTTTKVYRIKYDFNVASVLMFEEIQSLGVWISAYGTERAQLTYTSGGTFVSPVTPIEFYQFSWGRDERYKFALHTPGGIQYMGSTNANNVQPMGQPASYFYLVPVSNDQWNNTYKFNPTADMHNVIITVNFSASGPYTHNVVTL
ncbi:MAG: hypothetical protein EOP51_16720 [Sphingobacteriales bacterium]|nr:MAG: hypothetical protein EOP51_16720 [Sphingobacteriales bacterium]